MMISLHNNPMTYIYRTLYVLGVALILALLSHLTFAEEFAEGSDYMVISPRMETTVGEDKIEVIEFFWYGCPHCYTVEPYIKNWKIPENVELVRIPATFSERWIIHAKVYYALESLDRLDLHEVFFNAIHGRQQRRDLVSEDKIAEFFASFSSGISEDKFSKAYNSFIVNTKTQKADRLVREYAIKSVPTFIVNGRYLSSPSMVGSSQRLISALDYLINLEQEKS